MSFFDDTIQPKQAKKETPSSFFPSANVPVQTTPKTTVTRDLSLTPPSFSLSTPSVKTSTPMFSTKQVQPIAQPVPTITPIDRALTQKPTTGFFAQVETPEETISTSVAQKPSFFDVMQRQEQISSKPVSKSKELFDKYAPPAVKYVANYLSEGLYGTGQEIDFAGNMQESKGLVQGLLPSVKSTYQKVNDRAIELQNNGVSPERVTEISKVYAQHYTKKLSTDPLGFLNKQDTKEKALESLNLTKEEKTALNKVGLFEWIDVALDATNFTGVGSVGVKNIGKIIAKEVYPTPIKNILMKEIRNIPENLADELSRVLAKVNDPTEVEKIISKVDFSINKYKPTTLPDEQIFEEAKKYKSAEEFVKNNDLVFQGGEKGTKSEWWTTDMDTARNFANRYGELKDGEIRVAKFSDIPGEFRVAAEDWTNTPLSKQDYLKSQYGGKGQNKIITVPIEKAPKFESISSKSQLTDIWNKAQSLTKKQNVDKTGDEVLKEIRDKGISITPSIKQEMKKQSFVLKSVPIDEILKNDPDAKEFVDKFKGTSASKKSEPIVIGNWQGKNNSVMDGYHRLASLKNSGVTEISAYVSSDSQPTKQEEDKSLLAVHNLDERKLNFADKTGGLANPSIATIDLNKQALQGFGDISLVGNRDIIDPSKMTKGQTFGSDIYSPRYPGIISELPFKGQDLIEQDFKKYEPLVNQKVNVMDLQSDARNEITDSPLSMAKFLDESDIQIDKFSDYRTARDDLRQVIKDKGLENKYLSFVDDLLTKYNHQESFFGGWTPSGKKIKRPLTATEASKIMNKKDIRGGENFNGMGSVRAQATPRFKNVTDILKNKGRIVTTKEFQDTKKETEDKFWSILHDIDKYALHKDSNNFIERDRQAEALTSFIGGDRQWFDSKFKDVPKSIQNRINELVQYLQKLPTEYFETKYKRPVQISEFKGAVVPNTISKTSLDLLSKYGITNIKTYDPKIEGDRLSKLKEFQNGTSEEKLAFKKPLFSKQTGPKVDIETAKKLIEEVIPKGKIRLAFRDELIKGGVGMYSSPTGAIRDVLKPLIELYEEGGKVEVDTLYHEAGHYLFDKILSNEEKMKALEVARKNISVVDRAKYFLNGYTGEANILEEYLMDEYAKQKTKEGGFTGPYKTIFERIDEVIRQIIDVAKKLYARLKETIKGEKQVQTTAKYKRTGNAGEYDKPQSKEEKLKIAQEALEAGERRYALDDSKIYKIETRGKEDRLLVERGIQALNKQTKKESFLESLKITLPKELQLQKEALTFEKEAIQDNPARKLTSYMARRGQYKGSLPEVTGTGSSTFARRGDDIVTELGYKDSEEAREAFDKYIESKKMFEDKVLVYQKDKQDFLNKARAKRDAIITEKKVELATASTAKHIEELIGTKQNKEKIIKEAIEREKETQKRLVEEELQLNQYQEKVRQAQISERDKKTLLSKFKAVLSPISQTDNTTKKIYLDWEVSKLRSKEAGNKTYEQYKDKPENDLASIMEYEAGKQIRWIRDAFDDAYTQARRNDLGIRYKESYIPHVYNEKPAQIKEAIAKYMEVQKVEKSIIDDFKANGEIPEVIAIRLKIRPNFQKIRTFPDYATAMKYNLTPKFNTVAEHLAYYQEEMGKTLANKKLIDDLIAEGKILDAFDAPESWIEVKLPGRLRRSYYAQKNLADALNGQFRDEDNLSLAQEAHKRLGNLSQFAQSSVLTGGVPETTINNFAMGQAIRMLTTGVGEAAKLNLKGASSSVKAAYSFVRANFNNTSIKWFKSNQKYIDLMVDNNVPLFKKASDYDQNYKTWKNLLSAKSRRDARISLKTVGKDIVGIRGPKTLGKAFTSLLDSRAVGLSADIFNKSFSDKTFSNMMPQMQIQIFKDIYEGAVKDGVPSEEAAKFSANIVRNEFGMANDLGRTQNVKDVFNSYFFAPRFREGMVNIFINGAKAWTTEFKNPTFARSRSLIVGMIITYIMYNFLNKQLNDGDDMWENEPGREFALKIPLPSGRIIYTDFMPSSLAFVRNIGSGSLAFLRGDSKTAGQKFGTLFSIPIKIATEIAGNKDYFGRPIYEITDTLDDKIKKSAEHIGLGIAHPYIRELTKYFEGKQDIYQTVSMMMELPLKFSTEEKSIIARSYEEKNAKASLNAQERAKINDTIEIYDNVQKLKTEGNTGTIETLIDGMSDAQYQEYKMIMKYEEIQALKKAKNTEEATRIGDSLTDQEYLQYQAIKTIRTSQKREATGQKKIDAQKKPVFDSSSKLDERTVMESVKVYANAIGTDPVTAFNRIFTGQRIRYTAGGAIVVERMPLFESQKVKSERGATSDLKLDHTLPLSLGGSNDEGNLKLVPVSDWKSYTPVETHLSRLLKNNQISKEEAQKLILDFKKGDISADSILKL